MKKVLILLCAVLLLTACGCASDIPPIGAEHDCTQTYTHHPLNTYAILREEMERISSLIFGDNAKDLPFEVSSIYVDDANSTLVVGIKDINDEKINYFKENISDKYFIVFEEGFSITLTKFL